MDETLPVIEGLRLVARTDESGPGEVWRARVIGGLGGAGGERLPGELAGVGECEVRLLRLPVQEAIRARAHSVAADLLLLEDPGLVGIREVRTAYDGVALVLAPLPSPMLALQLLARRRQLSAGEIVTLGVALAWALAAAHAAGITHGRLRDADVLIDPGGRPMLAGIGVMGVLGSAGDPLGDVRALVRMLLSLLDTQSSGATKLADSLLQPPEAASELAAVLAAACPAAPIRLSEAPEAGHESVKASKPSRRRGNRPAGSLLGGLFTGAVGSVFDGALEAVRWRRVTRVVGVGVGIVVLAGVIGWVSAPGPSSSSPRREAASRVTNWSGVLRALDETRADAFARPGAIAIATFDAVGSAASKYDLAAVSDLRTQNAHARGLRMVLSSVAVTGQAAGQVTLAVTDSRSAYEVLDAQQHVLSRVAARAAARHVIVLRASDSAHEQWRVAEVRAGS